MKKIVDYCCVVCGRHEKYHDDRNKPHDECKTLSECEVLEKQGDLAGALTKARDLAKWLVGNRDHWKQTAYANQDHTFEVKKALEEAQDAIIKSSIVFKTFDGVEYMRIPDPVTVDVENDMACGRRKQSCATVWFRAGIEKEILGGKIPKDFMRCPGCGGNEFEYYDGDSYGDTRCLSCDSTTADLGWAWMNILFPDPGVQYKVDKNDMVKRT